MAGEAEKEFRKTIILDPTNAEAHAGLARVFESVQDNTSSRNEARASLALKPSVEAYLVLARLDLIENHAAAAEQNADRALALDPANAAAVALKRDIAWAMSNKRPSQP